MDAREGGLLERRHRDILSWSFEAACQAELARFCGYVEAVYRRERIVLRRYGLRSEPNELEVADFLAIYLLDLHLVRPDNLFEELFAGRLQFFYPRREEVAAAVARWVTPRCWPVVLGRI